MKKLLFIISLLFSITAFSQVHQQFGAYVDNLDSLYTHVGMPNQYVIALGRFNAYDSLGGIYAYNDTSTATEVPYLIFKVIGKDTGRWTAVYFFNRLSADSGYIPYANYANNGMALTTKLKYDTVTNMLLLQNRKLGFGIATNVVFGNYTMLSSSGTWNTSIGDSTLRNNTTGSFNNVVGGRSLESNTTGNSNNSFGYNSLSAATTASFNNAFGGGTLRSNTTGSQNTSMGASALRDNTTGSGNSGFGSAALQSNNGEDNTAIGDHASFSATSISNSTSVGKNAYYFSGSGYGNTAIGRSSFYNLASGNLNTAIGDSSGINLTSGSSNVSIGSYTSLPSATGSSQLNLGNKIYSPNGGTQLGVYTTAPTNVFDINGDLRIRTITSGAAGTDSVLVVSGGVLKRISATYYGTSSGGLATASNGLTASSTDVQLGGTLTANTTINASTFDYINSFNSLNGLTLNSTYVFGGQALTATGVKGTVGYFRTTSDGTDPTFRIDRQESGAAVTSTRSFLSLNRSATSYGTGVSSSIDFSYSQVPFNRIFSEVTGTNTTKMYFTATNSGATDSTLFTLYGGTGGAQLNKYGTGRYTSGTPAYSLSVDASGNIMEVPSASATYLTKANNLSDVLSTSTARTNLGATTVGGSLFTLTNPSAISMIRINADNSVSARLPSQFAGDLGATNVGYNIFTLTNPAFVSFPRINADNTITARTPSNVKVDLSLDNVENTALSTWAGTTNITTLGTITTGVWSGTALTSAKLPSSVVYNNQANTYTAGMKQSVQGDATNSGFRMVGVTADPSSLSAGDMWYRSDSTSIKYYDGTAARWLDYDSGELTYGGTLSNWIGTTPPSSLTSATYRWTRDGKNIIFYFWVKYGSNGNAITSVDGTLPADLPLPAEPSTFNATNDIMYVGNGNMAATQSLSNNGKVGLIKTGTGTYKFTVTGASSTARNINFTINYIAQ